MSGPFAYYKGQAGAAGAKERQAIAKYRLATKNFQKASGATLVGPGRRMSAIMQQGVRTGGWADPGNMTEKKYIDSGTGDITMPITPTFSAGQQINPIISGSGASNRIGRKVILKSLLIRYCLELGTPTGNDRGGGCRLLVVYDKQANATAAAIGDVIEDVVIAGSTVGMNNLANRDRFVTLVDELIEAIGQGGSQRSIQGKIYRKFSLEQIFNSGNAGTFADTTTGTVWLFAGATSSNTNPNILHLATRMRFTDA